MEITTKRKIEISGEFEWKRAKFEQDPDFETPELNCVESEGTNVI